MTNQRPCRLCKKSSYSVELVEVLRNFGNQKSTGGLPGSRRYARANNGPSEYPSIHKPVSRDPIAETARERLAAVCRAIDIK